MSAAAGRTGSQLTHHDSIHALLLHVERIVDDRVARADLGHMDEHTRALVKRLAMRIPLAFLEPALRRIAATAQPERAEAMSDHLAELFGAASMLSGPHGGRRRVG